MVDSAEIKRLKEKYTKVTRYVSNMNKAIRTVAGETGVTVPLLRMLAHCHLETGGTGDPKIVSIGTNACCPKPGTQCSPDCKAHGLFQIFWPPFSGVKWDKIYDVDYNCYLGAKVLAYRYKECGDWDGASMAFFAGSCVNVGVCDNSTGVCQDEYLTGIHQRMRELAQIGIDNTTGGGLPPTDTDPGTGNTPGDGSNCIGPVCVPSIDTTGIAMQAILSKLQGSVFPVGLLLIGLVLILIGIIKVL